MSFPEAPVQLKVLRWAWRSCIFGAVARQRRKKVQMRSPGASYHWGQERAVPGLGEGQHPRTKAGAKKGTLWRNWRELKTQDTAVDRTVPTGEKGARARKGQESTGNVWGRWNWICLCLVVRRRAVMVKIDKVREEEEERQDWGGEGRRRNVGGGTPKKNSMDDLGKCWEMNDNHGGWDGRDKEERGGGAEEWVGLASPRVSSDNLLMWVPDIWIDCLCLKHMAAHNAISLLITVAITLWVWFSIVAADNKHHGTVHLEVHPCNIIHHNDKDSFLIWFLS